METWPIQTMTTLGAFQGRMGWWTEPKTDPTVWVPGTLDFDPYGHMDSYGIYQFTDCVISISWDTVSSPFLLERGCHVGSSLLLHKWFHYGIVTLWPSPAAPTLTSQVQSWIALVALSIRSPCFLTSANAAFVLRPHVALVGFALWVLTKFGGPGPHQSHPKRTIRSNSFLAFSCGESEASHLSWSTIILWSYYCLYMLIYTHSWGMLRHDLVRHPSSPSTRDDPGWPGPGLAWNPDCRRGIAAPPCASPRVGTSNIHCPVQDCLENGWKWTLKASRPGFFLWTVYKSRYQSMNFSTQI